MRAILRIRLASQPLAVLAWHVAVTALPALQSVAAVTEWEQCMLPGSLCWLPEQHGGWHCRMQHTGPASQRSRGDEAQSPAGEGA